MGTVTIDGNPYSVYGEYAACDVYLKGMLEYRAQWNAADADEVRKPSLVSATRFMGELEWRSDITPSNETEVIEATYMLAGCLVVNPKMLGGAGGGSPSQGAVQSVADGKTEVRFFYSSRAVDARLDSVAALPREIQRKIRPFLVSKVANTALTAFASGTNGSSEFEDEDKFLLNE